MSLNLGPEWTALIDNFEVLGAVTSKTFTVPAGKRWLVFGGVAERDVSATLDIELYNENNKLILKLPQVGAGTSKVSFGCMNAVITAGAVALTALPLKAGWYIKYTWGAEQATPEVSLIVAEAKG